ncbi:MAG: twin-arginine translocase subunit TatC [Microbacterium sp.]
MTLAGHLIELRKRLIIAVVGLAVGMVIAFFVTDPIIWYITEPIRILDMQRGTETPFAQLVFSSVSSGFDLRMRIALAIGLLLSAPVWLWQVWAFIMPGLTRTEIRYTLSFVGAAIPLFFAGAYVAVLVAPHVIEIMSTFVPAGGVNYFDAQQYYDFMFKFVLVVGVSFVLPVFLVALNIAGVMSGRAILKGWRIAILIACVFAGITTPAADIFSMFLLAGILIVLYLAAAFVSLLFDRRRAKRDKAARLLPDAA